MPSRSIDIYFFLKITRMFLIHKYMQPWLRCALMVPLRENSRKFARGGKTSARNKSLQRRKKRRPPVQKKAPTPSSPEYEERPSASPVPKQHVCLIHLCRCVCFIRGIYLGRGSCASCLLLVLVLVLRHVSKSMDVEERPWE